jgi:hypothetical protein
MRTARIVALVVGSLMAIAAVVLVLGGLVVALVWTTQRDADGYVELTLDRLETPTAAVTAEEVDLAAEPGSPRWLVRAVDVDVRIRATPAASDRELFVGVGPQEEVEAFLAGVAHERIVDLDDGREAVLRRRDGTPTAPPPGEADFWTSSVSGDGRQELLWEAQSGNWAVVLMHADGSPGLAADVAVGVRSGAVLPLALTASGIGLLLLVGGVVLVVVGATGLAARPAAAPGWQGGAVPAGAATAFAPGSSPVRSEPVRLEARLEPGLSRWLWLVKWILVIPHMVVLAFLWVAFVVLTVVAGFAILITGRYPQDLFTFNVGVLRWTWRVLCYAGTGGLGTDRYPPFSLAPDPGYPAELDVARPAELSRPLVLVKWWLLAIPHYVVVAILVGGPVWWFGLLGVLAVVAGGHLLLVGRYPEGLFALVIGLNRWVFRTVAYAALMTDRYPPFRLDQGGREPVDPPPGADPPPVGETGAF